MDWNIVAYSAIFYQQDAETHRKVPAGVVVICISLNEIKKILEELELGPSGFGALASRKGVYLYHTVNLFSTPLIGNQ
jgi:signal recognition particle subunit SEC65